jgi:hypothetical protein
MATPQSITTKDKPVAVGVLGAQPASGALYLDAKYSDTYPFCQLRFRFEAFRVTVTDAAGSGSSGSAKIFDFNEAVVGLLGSVSSIAGVAEGSALTTAAGDAAYVIAFGSVAANAGDGALSGTEVDWGAATSTITNAAGIGTAVTTITGPLTPMDGAGTAKDVYLNWSGSAATIDATSTIDLTGWFVMNVQFLSDV